MQASTSPRAGDPRGPRGEARTHVASNSRQLLPEHVWLNVAFHLLSPALPLALWLAFATYLNAADVLKC